MKNLDISITENSSLWQDLPAAQIEEILHTLIRELTKRNVISSLENQSFPTELSVLLTDNQEIQKLNLEYRQKDKPTNILSFPQEAELLLTYQEIDKGRHHPLLWGDLVLAYETIQAEAEEEDISLKHHITHLLLHGLLHLLGYDHETDEETKVMQDLEIKILAQLNILNPYSH